VLYSYHFNKFRFVEPETQGLLAITLARVRVNVREVRFEGLEPPTF
jgi:hypothetical protein